MDTEENTNFGLCDNCGYETVVEKYGKDRILCDICATTFLSKATLPESQSNSITQGEVYIMKSIAYLMNGLVDALDIRDIYGAMLGDHNG